jgi:hypothetical protein
MIHNDSGDRLLNSQIEMSRATHWSQLRELSSLSPYFT